MEKIVEIVYASPDYAKERVLQASAIVKERVRASTLEDDKRETAFAAISSAEKMLLDEIDRLAARIKSWGPITNTALNGFVLSVPDGRSYTVYAARQIVKILCPTKEV